MAAIRATLRLRVAKLALETRKNAAGDTLHWLAARSRLRRRLSRCTSASWGTAKISSDIQIVREEIGTLKAAAKGEAPFEVRGRAIGLTGPLNRGRLASPIEIGLDVVERADSNVGRRDHGHSLAEAQL